MNDIEEEEIQKDYSEEVLEDSEEEVDFLESSDDDDTEEDDTVKFKKLGAYRVRLTHPVVVQNRITEPRRILIKVVPSEERTTSEIIQLPEMTEAIGIRGSEIENGAPCFASDIEGYTNAMDSSRKEFFDRKSPLILQRALEQGTGYVLVEEWKVREMTFPITRREILNITNKKKVEAKKIVNK